MDLRDRRGTTRLGTMSIAAVVSVAYHYYGLSDGSPGFVVRG
jgi:hypothetical protein